MGSRLKTDPDHLYEGFFEVAGPTDDAKEPHIVASYPKDFQDEVVAKELPRFCFPCDLSRYNPAGQLFTFVLTGIDNKQRFGFCRHPPGAKTALCLLSYLPWFDIFYKVLNKLATLKNTCEPAAAALLEQLYCLAVPKPERHLRITLREGDSTSEMLFTCPDVTKTLPKIPENINMTEYFSAVTPENMIILFVSLLYERRVLITSHKLHRLTACVHGAVSMLYPLHWQHIYIPVTPSHLIDYCSAPMPFLIGVHSSFMEQVRRMALDEVVILDADNNSIETPFNDLQTLPSEALLHLKHNLKNSSQVSGDGVARSFLKTLVYLLGTYKEALNIESGTGKIVFDREQFLANGSKHDMTFRKTVLQLQHFTQFVESRVNAVNQDAAIDDQFEQEWELRVASGSKIQEKIKTRLIQARAKSSVLANRVKENVKDAKDRTKHLAGKRITTMRDKLKFRETEDILGMKRDQPEISAPLHTARSTPSSPTTSPVLRRKPYSSSAIQNAFRPRTFMLPPQSKDKVADMRSKHYHTLEIDGHKEMTLEEALRDDSLLPARYSSMDLMPAVKPLLDKLDHSTPAYDETDSASQGSSGGPSTPQPLPRKKRDRKKQDGVDSISMGSNSSLSSMNAIQETSPVANNTSSNTTSFLPPPPRARPRGAPPPPPTQRPHQSANNSNPMNLIDISTDDHNTDVVHQFEDNFQPFSSLDPGGDGNGKQQAAPQRKESAKSLLEDYGLNFDAFMSSDLDSGTAASSSLKAPQQMRHIHSSPNLQAATAQQPRRPSDDRLPQHADAFSDLLSPAPPIIPPATQQRQSFSWAAPTPMSASTVSSSNPANPFSSQLPTAPQPAGASASSSSNPFQVPLTPKKTVEVNSTPKDPFADLVSIQKTIISPVNKDSPESLLKGASRP